MVQRPVFWTDITTLSDFVHASIRCRGARSNTASPPARTLTITPSKLTRAHVEVHQRAQQTNPCHPAGPSPVPAPMYPAVSRIAENAAKHHLLLAPLLFTILGAVGSGFSPVQHSLLVASASWAALWIPLVLRVGLYSNSGGRKKDTGWLAGAFLALAHVCDRAACDRDGIIATKVGIQGRRGESSG